MSDLVKSPVIDDDETMLTTNNNPFNPFTQFDEWFAFDSANGTDCCGLIDRFIDKRQFISEEDEQVAIEEAMNQIVRMNPTIYAIVHPGDPRYTMTPSEFAKASQLLMPSNIQ